MVGLPIELSSFTTLFISFFNFRYSIALSLSSTGRVSSSCWYVLEKCMHNAARKVCNSNERRQSQVKGRSPSSVPAG